MYLKNSESKRRSVVIALQPNRPVTVSQEINFTRRGLFSLEKLTTYDVYPIGMWYAWRIHRHEAVAVVYPERRGDLELPITSANGDVVSIGRKSVSVDIGDHRRGQLLSLRTDWTPLC